MLPPVALLGPPMPLYRAAGARGRGCVVYFATSLVPRKTPQSANSGIRITSTSFTLNLMPVSRAGGSQDQLVIRGAREHNLRNVNLELPRDALIVFTGISGSGK